jgi:hypothetical protein
MPATVKHAKSVTVADWSGVVTVANSTGGTTTAQASNLARPSDWNSDHNVTLQVANSDLELNQYFGPFPALNTGSTVIAPVMGSWYFDPVQLPAGMDVGRINMFFTYNSSNFLNGVVGSANNSGTAVKTAVFRNVIAFYEQGSGTNNTRLVSIWQGGADLSATQSINFSGTGTTTTQVRVTNRITVAMIGTIDTSGGTTSTTFTTSGSASVAASTMASTVPNSLITQNVFPWFTGSFMMMVPFASTLPRGNYWIGHMFTTSSGTSTTGPGNYGAGTCFNSAPGRLMLAEAQLTAFKRLGDSTVGTSASCGVPFHGALLTTTSSATQSLGTVNLVNTTGRLYFHYIQNSI